MENKVVNSSDIWYIVKDAESGKEVAQRVSNGKLVTVPVTTEILDEVKRQLEANNNFKRIVSKIDFNNENIIAYLYLILDQYVNFLDKDNLGYLVNMMKQLEKSLHIDMENAVYIMNLRVSLEKSLNNYDVDSINNFYDVLDKFQIHNEEYLNQFYNNEEKAFRGR